MSGVFILKDKDKMEKVQAEKIVVVKNVNSNGIVLQNAKGISLKTEGIKATEYFLEVQEQDANVDIQQAQFVAIENECEEADGVESQFVPLEMDEDGQIILQDKDVILWDELCRICANTSDKVVPIFSGDGLEHNLCYKIQNYLPLTVTENDTLPLQICYNCAATLLAWHEMTENCLDAQQRLTELQSKLNSKTQVQNNVSEEEAEEEEEEEKEDEHEEEDEEEHIVNGDNGAEMDTSINLEDQEQFEAEMKSETENEQPTLDPAEDSDWKHAAPKPGEFTYLCGLCEELYPTEIELLKHMRYEHEGEGNIFTGLRYECNVCNRSYASKNKLVTHLRLHDRILALKKKSGYKCEDEEIEYTKTFNKQTHKIQFQCHVEECKAVLASRRGILRHMRVHKDVRPIVCEHCGLTYRIEDDLKRHIDDVHRKIKKYLCDICGRSSKAQQNTGSFKDFRKRYKPSVPAKTRKSPAKSPKKATSGRSSSRVSKIKVEVPKDDPLRIDSSPIKKEDDSDDDYFEIQMKEEEEESSVTKSSSATKRPRRKQKLASPKNLECKQCGKSFRQRKSYDIHMRQHTGEKPFTCHICGKQFGQTGSLYYHLKHLHGGVKNHACDICGRCFAMKTAMEDHRRIHTGERPYVCDVCGKTFKTKASLYIHSKIHTDEYPFNCSYCKKPFRWKQQMISHLTTHTGEKNHICEICNKGFGVKNELTRHRRTHSTDKPFTCQKCGLSFGQKRYLTNHNRTRHKVNPVTDT